MKKFITNNAGFSFELETSKDFNDKGHIVDGRGFFVTLLDEKKHSIVSKFFQTEQVSLRFIHQYKGG